jgi:hypothetical protein
LIQYQQLQYHNTKVGASSTTTTSQHEGWSIINISTRLEIFNTKLASHQHQHEVGITTTSARGWKSSALSWHHNNINTRLEIFSTRQASQQHQHKDGNLQH